MGIKLLWAGLTLLVVSDVLSWNEKIIWLGAVAMVVGVVMLWLDK